MVTFASADRARARVLGLLACALAAPHLAAGATCTWTGSLTDTKWSNASNWSCPVGHPVPANGDDLVFPDNAIFTNSTNDIVGLSLASVRIGRGALNSYQISGNGVAFTTGMGLQFTAAAPGNASFTAPITLGNALVIANVGTAVATVGKINLNSWSVTFLLSGSMDATDIISGSGSIIKTGPGSFGLLGANTFVGVTRVVEGTVFLGNNSALGSSPSSGAVVLPGATLYLGLDVNMPRPLTLAGGELVTPFGGTWSGPVTLTANSSINMYNGGRTAVTGAIDGAFTLTKVGRGALTLSGNSPSFTGLVSLQGGGLAVNGDFANASVNVTAGAVGGTGTIGTIVTAPGVLTSVTPGPLGILHARNVTLSRDTDFHVYVGETPGYHSQLDVTGAVTLANASFDADLTDPTVTPQQNTVFTIISNHGTLPVVGTFAGLPEGARLMIDGFPFEISYVGGTGKDVTLATRIPASYFLSEGATGSFFDEDVLIANPNATVAPVSLTFLTPSASPVVLSRTLPAQSRTTIHVNQIPGLERTEVSTVVTSTAGLPLAVERSMFWDKTYYAGHTGSSVEQASRDWMFGEGSQGFFNTYVLLANANATSVDVTLTFLRENDTPVVTTVTVPPSGRLTVDCGAIPGIVNRSFGITVHGSQPIIAERAMYFGSTPTRLWSGGHESAGVPAPARSWFLAEGATGGFFDTFVLLSNPQDTTAHVTMRFLLDTGDTITEVKTLPAKQRLTINIAAEPDPRLRNAAVSTVVTSDVPIVVERSMYWKGDVVPWTEGHNSFGVVEAGTHWGLAEGRLGGPLHFHTYILLANPQATPATVTVTFLRETAAPIVKTYTVPPTSRFNIDVNAVSPDMHDESIGADVRVTNGVPIVVERSLYWDSNGVFFKGGTNATGLRLP